MTIILDQDRNLVASYRLFGLQTVSVLAKTLDGRSLAGVRVIISSLQDGAPPQTNIIPTNFTAKYGQTFSVFADSTSAVAFRFWNNDKALTNESYTLKVQGNSSITAYYQKLPLPYTVSGKGNHTITVVAHTTDGGELVGAYFQVRIHAVWNHYASGFTPASVTVPAGIEELVMYHCAQVPPGCSDKFFVYRYYNNTMPYTLTRWQYVNVTGDMTFHSFYEIIPAPTANESSCTSVGPIPRIALLTGLLPSFAAY